MKRYTAGQARAQLAHVLNAAERGEAVVIERRGVRFIVQADRPRRRVVGRSVIEFADPAVIEGEWTWTSGRQGLRFSRRGRKR
jgi:antitoxin (DNA-binding transcriptional repressor) of toxin-antitoxin stability system